MTYLIEWSPQLGPNGTYTLTSPEGPDIELMMTSDSGVIYKSSFGQAIGVISTREPLKAEFSFDQSVRNVSFEIYDVDASGWSDQVSVFAFDAAGDPVPVQVSDLDTHHRTDGAGTVWGTASGRAPGGPGAPENVTFTISDIASRFEVIFDDGPLGSNTGRMEIGPVRFELGVDPVVADGTTGNDSLQGDDGNDTLRGLDGDDTLIGLNGRDLLDGGAGVDRMEGGASDDRYIVDNAADLIVELLGGGARDLAEASVDYTLPDHVERLLLSGTGNLNGTGNAGHNVLIGNAGDNHLQGLAGDDWLDAGPGGDDTLDGGAGTDMASFWQVPPAAQVWQTTLDLDLATGMATAQADSFELIGIENVTGTSGRDILRGDGGDNLLRGLTGDDWLQGRGGNDTLEGGNGIDTASYANAAARLVADLGAGVVRSGTDEDQLISIEGLRASRFSDVITTGNGPTYISAKEGHDWIVAGYGVDVIDGGRHIDTVSYAGANLGISASLKNGRGWTGAATGDRYAGVENLTGTGYGDALSGDDGRNHLRGLDGNDALFGYGGHDVLIGGTGDDMLFGGNGTDRAVFAGDLADYTITRTSEREITVVGADGIDQLDSVEYLQFDDTTARIWDLEIV
ncbi:calcium-binding protein [Falsiruegeria mediterranea]|uniref:Bifunctional hemolysin/adenylate cyclase n=1 Tax=Falsiruegeria mediterranea M17 TaxID=1200281 RepID=A0A2R8CGE1_9RHOB|nr:calcium-binding protein [Falsiruegeria mediterranea]SPJ31513.1 Bifunctional hemolysin/adenylate cyclase [Falsiruegeria mediterranea M17]